MTSGLGASQPCMDPGDGVSCPSDLSALPTDLLSHRRFLPWQVRPRRNGRQGKAPCAVLGGRLYPHDPLNPRGWMTAAEALGWVEAGAARGIGVVLTPRCGWVGIDLDDCMDEAGHVSARARTVLGRFPSAYAERSPGKRGLHLLVRGELPPGWRRQPGLELVDRGYLTVTGDTVRPEADASDCTAALATWHDQQQPRRPERHSPPHRPAAPVAQDDAALIRRAMAARSGGAFSALWHGGRHIYPSASEGDLALLLMLQYWLGDHASEANLDRLFRLSGRYRPRWDEPAHAPYGQRTIRLARAIRAGEASRSG